MLSDVSFGRYYPTKSFIHRLDPRVKLLLLIAYIVMIFLAKNFLTLGFCVLFLCLAVAFSGVPVTAVLKSLKAVIFLVIFTAVLNVLFYDAKPGDTVYFWVVTILLFGLGSVIFKRLKPHFADVL